MFTEERKFESVMKRIGASMLIFIAAFNLLCGGTAALQQLFADMLFPNSAVVYAITDVLCSLAYCASFILPVLFFYLISKKSDAEPMDLELKLPERRSVFKILSILFIGISVILTMAYLNSILFPASSQTNEALFDTDLKTPYRIVLMFLSTAVIPAFIEELMFRGMVYANLRPYGKGVAIMISALLFGFMHQNAGQLLYATAAGIVLAVVYEMTGSFWCCVLLHFFNNFLAIIEQVLFQQCAVERASLMCSIIESGIFLTGLIFAALWMLTKQKELRNQSAEGGAFFGQHRSVAPACRISGKVVLRGFFNPVMIVFLVFAVGQMIAVWLLY